MEIKMSFKEAVTPYVDGETGKLTVRNECTEPMSFKFGSKNEMVSMAISILKAVQENHDIVTFNTKGVDVAAYNSEFKNEVELHDEDEAPKIPRLIGKE